MGNIYRGCKYAQQGDGKWRWHNADNTEGEENLTSEDACLNAIDHYKKRTRDQR